MKKSRAERITLWIVFVIFFLYGISLLLPLVWTLINSFKTNREFFEDIWAFPSSFLVDNYISAFTMEVSRTNLAGMFGNSFILVVGCTLASVFVSTLCAYVVSKFRFVGRNIIYTVAIATMLIPTVGTLTATYQLMVTTGLYNTYIGIIIMSSGGLGINFVLIYGYFQSISWSYAESAMIDGAGDFRVFIQIMLPQIKPALVAVCIISAINYWNDYFTPYMYLRSHPTVAVGLQSIVNMMSAQSDWPRLFAAMIVSIIPVLVLFIVFQKTIMENTVAGGLKG